MQLTENFRQAMEDYIFLLNKKYPEKAIHQMVSTRYSLNLFERSMLFRGISTNERAETRKKRIIEAGKLKDNLLHIDLFNVLFTIAAYLRGFQVYLSNDGMLRDASESHECSNWVDQLDKALNLSMSALEALQIQKAILYIDNPFQVCGHIEREIAIIAKTIKPFIQVIPDKSPDHLIRKVTEGIIATSDSTIIDKSAMPVFDLPRHVLEQRFSAKLLQLSAHQTVFQYFE